MVDPVKEGKMAHHTPKDKVLNAMKKAGEPLTETQIADATGLDKEAVGSALTELQKSGAIVSPKSGSWEPG
jgi:predicted transcriptional regulator